MSNSTGKIVIWVISVIDDNQMPRIRWQQWGGDYESLFESAVDWILDRKKGALSQCYGHFSDHKESLQEGGFIVDYDDPNIQLYVKKTVCDVRTRLSMKFGKNAAFADVVGVSSDPLPVRDVQEKGAAKKRARTKQ